jgi:hypothetical protein
MASENPLPDSSLPVKVDVPDIAAPPTLAEPASGPAAEMSGALTGAASTQADQGRWMSTRLRRVANCAKTSRLKSMEVQILHPQ